MSLANAVTGIHHFDPTLLILAASTAAYSVHSPAPRPNTSPPTRHLTNDTIATEH